MSINRSYARFLLKNVKSYGMKGSLLTLGVQDVWASHEEAEGVIAASGLPAREIPAGERKYSLSIEQNNYAYTTGFDKFVHMNDFFKMAGFDSVDSMDVFPNESPSVLHDLNQPVPASLEGRFDALIDLGVLEHVFDVARAIENVATMVKVGGVVVQWVPLCGWHNACFYNFQPQFFYEAYGSNGFEEIRTFVTFHKDLNFDPKNEKVEYREYRYGDEIAYRKKGYSTNVVFVGRKAREVRPFVKPVQGAYRRYFEREARPDAIESPSALRGWLMGDERRRHACFRLYRKTPAFVHGLRDNVRMMIKNLRDRRPGGLESYYF